LKKSKKKVEPPSIFLVTDTGKHILEQVELDSANTCLYLLMGTLSVPIAYEYKKDDDTNPSYQFEAHGFGGANGCGIRLVEENTPFQVVKGPVLIAKK